MSNINFKINTDATMLYNWFIDDYMVLSPVYSMVYIYGLRLASGSQEANNSIIAQKLNIFESDVVKAWEFWKEKGIVNIDGNTIEFLNINKASTVKKAKTSYYNPDEVKRLSQEDKSLDQLITSVEKIIGRTLSHNNINIVTNMYDGLRLPYEVIITLISYYSDKNLSYIEKIAISWAEKGIVTIEQAEEELNSYSVYTKIIRFFGVTNRSYTESEKKFMSVWVKDYKTPMELIKLACERTVKNTGKVSLSYANKILTNWYSKGITSLEQVASDDESTKRSNVTKATIKPVKNIFTNYDQKIYTEEEINEILKRKANS